MEKINEKPGLKRVLISPLDWGLGHVTRCIPLIRLLRENNCEVIVAADENQEILVRAEFRDIVILRQDGYGITYSKRKTFFLWKIAMQLPKIYRAAKKEKKWVKKITDELQIDGIISDNRLGFCNNKVPSVFITHQLFILTGFSFLNNIVRKINYQYINQFSACWVPDLENNKLGLSGMLSHPSKKPKTPVKYIGILSRFEKQEIQNNNHIMILISGPEPQRSIFEDIILKQLSEITKPVVFVRGLPNNDSVLESSLSHLTIHNHLPSEKLNGLMQSAELVITRAGYSTIMDLAAMGKNAVLVPTPGQTEQEYLANHLFGQRYFLTANQSELSLKELIEEAKKFEFRKMPELKLDENIVKEWISSL